MTQVRDAERIICWMTAMILVEGQPEAPCVVTDITVDGAGLLLATQQLPLPERFRLRIDAEDITYHARPIWRHDNRMGVQFLP